MFTRTSLASTVPTDAPAGAAPADAPADADAAAGAASADAPADADAADDANLGLVCVFIFLVFGPGQSRQERVM